MNVLILGSGGREHAFAWKIAQSNKVTRIFIAPGNAGTQSIGENVPIDPGDFETVGKFALKNEIGMLIVGPEVPLVDGIHDYFLKDDQLCSIPVIGPVKRGAMLEGSKDYAKSFMIKYGIPTAAYKSFCRDNQDEAAGFLKTLKSPYVLKADGLAAGKGVLIIDDYYEALNQLEEMFSGKFGSAGNTVVIEEFLRGIELSVFVLTDGENYKILPEAKDYKRIGEGDTGLNTGGMGAVSPVPFADKEFMKKVEDRVIIPTLKGLKEEDICFKGFIFIGLMNSDGDPQVIEYNVRMGDPEAEVVIPRIESDMFELLLGVAEGTLDEKEIRISDKLVATVMLVSGGYPDSYERGKIISGIDKTDDSIIFHAGTKQEGNSVVSSGGRVIAISSFGQSISEALNKSYVNADIIDFEAKYYRKDIGFDLK